MHRLGLALLHALTWALLSFSVGCGSEPTPPASAPADPPPFAPPSTTPPAPTAEPAVPAPTGDLETACARARPCCMAFSLAIGDEVEAERARIACEQMDALDELGEASGEACLAAIDGWRRALELAEREIPGACL